MNFKDFINSKDISTLSYALIKEEFANKLLSDDEYVQYFQILFLLKKFDFLVPIINLVKQNNYQQSTLKDIVNVIEQIVVEYEKMNIPCYYYAYFIYVIVEKAYPGLLDPVQYVSPRNNDLDNFARLSGNLPTFGKGGFLESSIDYTFSDNKKEVLTGIKSDYPICTIPSGVKTLSPRLFVNKQNIQFLTLPSTISSIPEEAFADNNSLRYVLLSGNVALINKKSFYRTSNLANVLALGATGIEESAFEFSDIRSINFFNPNRLSYIKKYAFKDCKKISKIIAPNAYVMSGAFNGAMGLKELSFKNHPIITSLKELFKYDNNDNNPGCALEKVSISFKDNNNKIPDSYFKNMTSLKEIIILGEISEIGKNAFSGCSSLEKITINYKKDDLPEGIFKDCSSLVEVTLSSTTKVPKSAFENCVNLKTLTLAPQVTFIGESAFRGCKNLENINFVYVGDTLSAYAFEGASRFNVLDFIANITKFEPYSAANMVFPDGIVFSDKIESIKAHAFDGAEFPEKKFSFYLTNHCSYEPLAFANAKIKRFRLETTSFKNLNGEKIEFYQLFANDLDEFNNGPTYNLSFACNEINEEAFKNHHAIAQVSFYNQCQKINKNAFENCKNLRVARFQKDGNGFQIGEGAFKGCSSLTYILSDENSDAQKEAEEKGRYDLSFLSTLESDVFNGCSNIKELIFNSAVSVKRNALRGLNNLQYVELHFDRQFNEYNKFFHLFADLIEEFNEDYKNLTKVKASFSANIVPKDFFKGCVNLKEVEIVGRINYVDSYAFADTNITDFIFSSIDEVRAFAFKNVSSLSSLDLVNTKLSSHSLADMSSLKEATFKVKSDSSKLGEILASEDGTINTNLDKVIISFENDKIPEEFFANTKIREIVIEGNILEIGKGAFKNCSSLQNLDIKLTSDTLLDETFKGCSSLISVNFSSVKYVKKSAFEDCTSLNYVGLNEEVLEMGQAAFKNCSSLEKIEFNFVGEVLSSYVFEGVNNINIVDFIKHALILEPHSASNRDLSNCTIDFLSKDVKRVCSCAFENSEFPQGFPLELTSNAVFEKLAFLNSKNIEYIIFKSFDLKDADNQKIEPYLLFSEDLQGFNENQYGIKFIEINTTENIPKHAFRGWMNIEKVLISEYTDYIPESCFEDCTSLKKVLISSNNVIIQKRAFYNCKNLVNIFSPSFLAEEHAQDVGVLNLNFASSIGEEAFSNCSSITKVISTNNYSINKYVFKNVTSITSAEILIGDNYMSNGNKFFELFEENIDDFNKNYAHITHLHVYVSGSIGPSFFEGLTNIQEIDVEGEIAILESSAFKNLTNLTSLNMNYTGEEILESTFEGCSSLENLPEFNNVTIIKEKAFKDMKALKEVYFNHSIKVLEKEAFYNCENLKEINSKLLIDVIKENTFSGCKNLTRVDLTHIYDIENGAFDNCSSLNNLEIGYILSPLGEIFKDSDIKYIKYLGNRIDHFFMADLPHLEVVECDNLIAIGMYAFSNSHNLKEIPSLENCIYIGDNAFEYTSLLEINIPESVNNIGDHIFEGCNKLEKVTLPLKNKEFKDYFSFDDFEGSIFVNISGRKNQNYFLPESLKEVVITSLTPYIGEFSNLNVKLVIEDNIKILPPYLFYKSIGDIEFSLEKVECIDEYALYDTNMRDIEVPNIISISVNAFNFNQIERLVVGGKLKEIDYDIFAYSSLKEVKILEESPLLKEEQDMIINKKENAIIYVRKEINGDIIIPDEVELIKEGCFKGCSLITSIDTNNVTLIEKEAFMDMDALKILNIRNIDAQVDKNILANSKNIETIYLPKFNENITLDYFLKDVDKDKHLNIYINNDVLKAGFNGGFFNFNILSLENSKLEKLETDTFKDMDINELILSENIEEVDDFIFNNTTISKLVPGPLTDSDGVLFYKNKLIYAYAKNIKELIIDENIISLALNAFEKVDKIQKVALPHEKRFALNSAFKRFEISELECGDVNFEKEFPNSKKSLRILKYYGSSISLDQFENINELYLYNVKKLKEGSLNINNSSGNPIKELLLGNINIIERNIFNDLLPNESKITITNLSIEGKIEHIDEHAFHNVRIENIKMSNIDGNYRLIHGALFDKDNNILYFEKNAKEKNIVFEEEINKICDYAFNRVKGIKKLVFKHIKEIGNNALANLEKLDTLIISKELEKVGDVILFNSEITQLQIPFVGKNKEELKDLVYLYSNNIIYPKYLYLSKQTDISKYPFRKAKIENIILSNDLVEIKKESFKDNNVISKLVIPENVKKIEKGAFLNCGNGKLDIYLKELHGDYEKGYDITKNFLMFIPAKKANIIVDPQKYHVEREKELRGFLENE